MLIIFLSIILGKVRNLNKFLNFCPTEILYLDIYILSPQLKLLISQLFVPPGTEIHFSTLWFVHIWWTPLAVQESEDTMKGAGWGAAALAGTVATHICPTQDHQHHLYFIRSELNIKLKRASYRSFISAFQHTADGFDMFIFSWMGKQLTYNLPCDCWEQESRALWVFWSVSCRKKKTSNFCP